MRHRSAGRPLRLPCRRVVGALAVGAALAPGRAWAQGGDDAPLPQLVQELFVAATVQAQGRGQTQVTTKGGTSSREDPGAHLRALVEYGITDRVQLGVLTPTLEGHARLGDAGDEYRRVRPSLFVAVLPGARPFSLSLSAGAAVASGVAPTWEAGVVAARGMGRVQLHGASALAIERGTATLTETLAALYDAGALTPTLTLAHDAEGLARWALVPGLFAHPGPRFELGVGMPVSLAGGRTVRTARFVVTAEF